MNVDYWNIDYRDSSDQEVFDADSCPFCRDRYEHMAHIRRIVRQRSDEEEDSFRCDMSAINDLRDGAGRLAVMYPQSGYEIRHEVEKVCDDQEYELKDRMWRHQAEYEDFLFRARRYQETHIDDGHENEGGGSAASSNA